jgi:hypothetical protein
MPREYTLAGEEGTRVPKIAVENASEGGRGEGKIKAVALSDC